MCHRLTKLCVTMWYAFFGTFDDTSLWILPERPYPSLCDTPDEIYDTYDMIKGNELDVANIDFQYKPKEVKNCYHLLLLWKTLISAMRNPIEIRLSSKCSILINKQFILKIKIEYCWQVAHSLDYFTWVLLHYKGDQISKSSLTILNTLLLWHPIIFSANWNCALIYNLPRFKF